MRDKQTWLWAAAVAGVAAAFLLFITRPQWQRIMNVEEQVQSEQTSIADGGDGAGIPALQAQVEALSASVGNMDERIPPQQGLGTFIEDLARSATARKLRTGEIQPGQTSRRAGVNGMPVVMRVSGPFKAVFGLLQDIERMPRLTHLDRFNAETDSERPGEVNAELQLRIFCRS